MMGMLVLHGILVALVATNTGKSGADDYTGKSKADGYKAGKSIRVMTYNIRTASQWARTHGGDVQNGRTWNKRRNNVARAFKIAKAIVVGTQEGLDQQIEYLAKTLKYSRVGAGRGTRNEDENEYAALLYNAGVVELIASGNFWLSSTPNVPGSTSWNTTLPRVATWGIFRFTADGGALFAVLNTHLDHTSEWAREKSALLLRQRAHEIAAKCDKCPVFLTADFNGRKSE